MKKSIFYPLFVILALCGTALGQTLVEGKNAAGATVTQNPVIIGGVNSTGKSVGLRLNDDGSLSVTTKPTGAVNLATGQVTTSTTSGTLVAARATRRSVAIRNADASITIYYGAGTVTSANGFPLKPGESQAVDTTAAINVVAASGTPAVAYVETYD
jgi:hypothetical protein